MKLQELGLSNRARHVLESLGIDAIKELCERTPKELLTGRGCGKHTLREITDALARVGLRLHNQCPWCGARLNKDEL